LEAQTQTQNGEACRGFGPTPSNCMHVAETTISTPEYTWNEETHNLSWRKILLHALAELGGRDIPLKAIYGRVKTHPKVQGKEFWRERIRGTLEGAQKDFVRTGHGVWSLATLYSEQERAEYERLRRERWPKLGPREATS
jgi:hypothetical protein